jgi:hypothetical protein
MCFEMEFRYLSEITEKITVLLSSSRPSFESSSYEYEAELLRCSVAQLWADAQFVDILTRRITV